MTGPIHGFPSAGDALLKTGCGPMQKRFIHTSALKFINTVIMCVPFIVCWFMYYEPLSNTVNSKQSSALLLFSYIVCFFFFCQRLDGFRFSLQRIGELIFSQILAAAITDVFAVVLIWMVSVHFPNLLPGLLCFAVQACLSVSLVILSQDYYFRHHKPVRSMVIYDVRQGMEELIHAYGLEKRFDVAETCAIEDILDNLDRMKEYEVVLLCGVHSHDRNIVLKACVENDIRVYLIPRVGDVIMSGAERIHMLHLPILRVKRYSPSTEYIITKRLFDLIVSGLLLLILSPLFAVVALCVRSDGGPAFYRQTRLTKNGREFRIIKFRSMRVDAEKYSGAVMSSGENDPRITRVGHVIRACRLDELPQLINIFKGEMSFVGPRPERPEIAAEYEKDMPEFRLRLQAKAGLTGYAQVFGKYNTTPYDKLLMDLTYIAHPSLLEELLILVSTLKILFVKDSTEGIAAGAVNAEDENYQPDRRRG